MASPDTTLGVRHAPSVEAMLRFRALSADEKQRWLTEMQNFVERFVPADRRALSPTLPLPPAVECGLVQPLMNEIKTATCVVLFIISGRLAKSVPYWRSYARSSSKL